MKERRLASRYRLVLPVAVSSVPAPEGTLQGWTRDIFAWGVYFTIDQRLESGTTFKFSVMPPEGVIRGTRVSVDGQAKIVRVEEEEDNAGKHLVSLLWWRTAKSFGWGNRGPRFGGTALTRQAAAAWAENIWGTPAGIGHADSGQICDPASY